MDNEKPENQDPETQQQQDPPAAPRNRKGKQGQRANAVIIEAFQFLLQHVAIQSPKDAAKAKQLSTDIANLAGTD